MAITQPVPTFNNNVLVGKGNQSLLNVTTATGPTVVKATPGRVAKVNVITAGAAVGGVYDQNVVTPLSASQLLVIPTAVGTIDVDFPTLIGIMVSPGAGQLIAISFT